MALDRAASVTPTPSSLDALSLGAGTAPLPATKSTHNVDVAARSGVPSEKLPPLLRGCTVLDADREARGTSMTPDPAAVYCEVHDWSKIHLSHVWVPEVVPPPVPPDLQTALDQPGATDAVLSYMAQQPEFAAALLDGRLFRMPVDGVSGEAAPSAPALSPEEKQQLTEELLKF
ncbi:hypothetical protein HPB47_017320 [Ixodes persulcatus]|uniref:Uncharacterized protein n=1 Tax=Ixodes persulcatus TaxID=34615 RepID=A0AC60QNM0_IXOPE|nr:hypothetical protein HPB47_017320 [Ixodes persulcatus]